MILQPSTWYEEQINIVQKEIVNIRLIGIKSTGDGNSKVEFEKRLSDLIKLEAKLQDDYENARIKEGYNDESTISYLPRADLGF